MLPATTLADDPCMNEGSKLTLTLTVLVCGLMYVVITSLPFSDNYNTQPGIHKVLEAATATMGLAPKSQSNTVQGQ
jgi:hypothetical protein